MVAQQEQTKEVLEQSLKEGLVVPDAHVNTQNPDKAGPLCTD